MPRPRSKSPFPGLNRVTRRAGGKIVRVEWYHRATGKRLRHDPSTPAGALEVHRLDEQAAGRVEREGETLAKLIRAYGAPDAGRAGRIRPLRLLAPRTRRDYEEVLESISAETDSMVLARLRPRVIQALVDGQGEAHGWARGDKLLSVLRAVFNWAIFHELARDNPCVGCTPPKRPSDMAAANRPWKDAERAAFFAAASPQVRVVFGLCAYASMNVRDAITVPKSALVTTREVRDGAMEEVRRIVWRRTKNSVPFEVEVGPLLGAILDAAPPHAAETIAANSRGASWTYGGIDTARDRLLDKLERAGQVAPGLTWHGLRHTVGSVAAEDGADASAIAAAIHNKSTATGLIYSRGAQRGRLANRARAPLLERDAALIGAASGFSLQQSLQQPPEGQDGND